MNRDRTWLLIGKKLAGEANAEELQELEGLLRSDPDMHYALQNITDLWNLSSPEQNNTEDAFNRHLNRLKASGIDWEQKPEHIEMDPDSPSSSEAIWGRFRRRKAFLLMGIAVALLLIAAELFLYNSKIKPGSSSRSFTANHTGEKNEITTRNGSKTKITLPDGSKVWLNAGSKLTYNKDFGNNTREIELTGEAFFDVVSLPLTPSGGGGKSKTEKMPFIIHTPQIDVHVVGTAFNVKSYPGDRQTETSLLRGKVEILIHNRPDEKIILRPNEKLVVMNDEEMPRSPLPGKSTTIKNQPFVSVSKLSYTPSDSIQVETAWVQNKLVFDNESFNEVAAKMERWYNVQFQFNDKQTQELRFSGVFENETIEQALAYMSITAPFHYAITGNKITIRR
jgi:ferric-dicitrate binding protein FerR (iron transport regulator)